MGQAQNSKGTLSEKIKALGSNLPEALKGKALEDYRAFDIYELDQAFDNMPKTDEPTPLEPLPPELQGTNPGPAIIDEMTPPPQPVAPPQKHDKKKGKK